MALHGTLDDIGIIDLLQFPSMGRRTGELIVSQDDDTAHLFYRDGRLVHATTTDWVGEDALVVLLDWSGGEFEFCAGVGTEGESITADLHRAIMAATKTLDERRAQAARAAAEEATDNAASGSGAGGELAGRLQEYPALPPSILSVDICDAEGATVASLTGVRGEAADRDALRVALLKMSQVYPREGMRRLIVEDPVGTAVAAVLPADHILVIMADDDSPLGATSVVVGKILAHLGA